MQPNKTWTDEELMLFGQLIAKHKTNEQIAEALDRSVGSIQRKRQRTSAGSKTYATTIARRGLRDQVTAKRKCLRCGKQFASESIGNRICPGCSNTNSRMPANMEGVSA